MSIDPKVDHAPAMAKIQTIVNGCPGLQRNVRTDLKEWIKEVLTSAGATVVVRPILMTALATRLAPVSLAQGGNKPGREIERPMAVVILGRLVTSTLLNLGLMPALYLAFGRTGHLGEEELITQGARVEYQEFTSRTG